MKDSKRAGWVIIGVALAIFTGALTYSVVSASTASSTAASAHDVTIVLLHKEQALIRQNARLIHANHLAQQRLCHDGNVTRAADIRLWYHLDRLASPQVQSEPALQQFLYYVHVKFAPLDCRAV